MAAQVAVEGRKSGLGVPRADDLLGAPRKSRTLLNGERSGLSEDVRDLAKYILTHRVWLGPHAASHGVTTEMVIDDIVSKVPVP